MLPYRDLSIPRREGPGCLSATWFPAYVAPRGAVLLLHPWMSWGRAYFHRRGRVEALRAAGYHALTFDFPGFGASGAPSGFDDRAVEDALDLLDELSGGLDLFIWGVSSGGYWAHPVLSRSDRVAGAMFEDVSPHALELLWKATPLARPVHVFFRHFLREAYGYLDARLHAAALHLGAMSYVSGALDSAISPEDTRALAGSAGGGYSIVQGAHHLGAIKLANRALIRTALDTFERGSDNTGTAALTNFDSSDSPTVSVRL